MTDLVHVPSQCPSVSQRYLIVCRLVDLLVTRENVCPACMRSILLELADESSVLWSQLNEQNACLH